MTDLDKLRDDAKAARWYSENYGVKSWTEHALAPLAIADAALARIAKVEAVVRLLSPDDITPAGKRILERALAQGGPDAAM